MRVGDHDCDGIEVPANVSFDIGRYGIDIVASPRHADGLVLTGAITRNMATAPQLCWAGMPDPKLVIAVEAISGSPSRIRQPWSEVSSTDSGRRSTCPCVRPIR